MVRLHTARPTAVLFASLLVLSLSAPSAVAQQTPPDAPRPSLDAPLTPRTLTSFQTIPLSIPEFSFVGLPQCSASGRMFFAIDSPVPLTDAGFFGISTDGQTQIVYKLPENLAKQPHSALFYASADGELNLLVKTQDGVGWNLLRYNTDAHLEQQDVLPVPDKVIVSSFGVTQEGYTLVFGYDSTPTKQTDSGEKSKGVSEGRTYRAIFNPSGTLVTTLHEDKVKVDANGSLEGAPQDQEYVQAVGTNFYWTSSNSIFEMDTSGNILHKVKIPKPDLKDIVAGLRISGDIAEVTLAHKVPTSKYIYQERYLLLNIDSGDPYGLYLHPNDGSMYLTCFDWREGFTFWSMSKKGIRIVHALMP